MLNITIFKHAPILVNGKHILSYHRRYDNMNICLEYRGSKYYFKHKQALELEEGFVVIYLSAYKIGANLGFRTPRNFTLQRATGQDASGRYTWYTKPNNPRGSRQVS